jgi:hypothetical protein
MQKLGHLLLLFDIKLTTDCNDYHIISYCCYLKVSCGHLLEKNVSFDSFNLQILFDFDLKLHGVL